MPRKKTPAAPLEPRTVKLPAKPAFERPAMREEEHRRVPKPMGRYRRIKDLGKPTAMQKTAQETEYNRPKPKR